MWDEHDEALQPEWEIDPKDLEVLEKVRLFVGKAAWQVLQRDSI